MKRRSAKQKIKTKTEQPRGLYNPPRPYEGNNGQYDNNEWVQIGLVFWPKRFIDGD